jgi:hypothetical protein
MRWCGRRFARPVSARHQGGGGRDNELVLLGGERIKADGVIDARGAANLSMLELGWRKSVAREFRFSEPHKVDRPVLIDATVDQHDGFRFMQCTPFSGTEMRIEDCYLSDAPEPQAEISATRIDAYLAKRKWKPAEMMREETNSAPVPIGGEFGSFWRVGGARVAKIGLRGGFFHPATGSPLPDAVRTALLLAGSATLRGRAPRSVRAGSDGALAQPRILSQLQCSAVPAGRGAPQDDRGALPARSRHHLPLQFREPGRSRADARRQDRPLGRPSGGRHRRAALKSGTSRTWTFGSAFQRQALVL